ncbi:hypothetical protein Gotur_017713 [Gossypium turneri]
MVVLNDSKLDLGKHLAVVFKENANPNNGEALGDNITDKIPLTKSLNSMVELINAQLDMEMYKGLKALKGKHTLGSGNSKHNKKGGHKVRKDCLLFKDFIEMANLQDLGFKGPNFMWHRDDLYERLDRAISDDTWTPFQISGCWVEHPSFPNFVKEKWCLKAEPLFTPKDLSHFLFAIWESRYRGMGIAISFVLGSLSFESVRGIAISRDGYRDTTV